MAKSSNNKSLVIVESPAKAKTINKYLGSSYEVKASMGHIRDLPSKGINVDIENNFEPTYAIMPGKKRTITSLKAAAKKCDTLYLATDLDREGEAIAWHLSEILGIPEDRVYRVVFNAITQSAIQNAFANPGKIDLDKVMAQQARRILDRIVGYQISPLLWKKVARGLSAGRVQSVAVKLIVEREQEIRDFKPDEYWLIPACFTTDMDQDYSDAWKQFIATKDEKDKGPTLARQQQWLAARNGFKAELYRVAGKKFEAKDKTAAQRVFDALRSASFQVGEIQKKESTSRPPAPFITSTLQQAAANQLGFTAKRTMRVAQQLYEGIEVGSMGALGLITYMRTDSTHLSPESLKEARHYIETNIGKDYLPGKANLYTSKKNAQQAHEAIRVTDVDLEPQQIKRYLSDEQFKLYDLIWRRFVACQMTPAKWAITTADINADTAIGPCVYRATGRIQVFDGFGRIWPTFSTQQKLPALEPGGPLKPIDIVSEQHFTKPPARYNEASLVKTLEKEGIGRPSTYASIISTIQDRGYVEQIDRRFHATDLGEVVTRKLNEYFPKIMDVAFTRDVESQLDQIEEQHRDWLGVLNQFYGPFKAQLETATKEMKHAKAETQPSDYNCPECGKKLEYRFGKNGRFLSCSGYPDCKFASPCDKEGNMVAPKVSSHKCPTCGKAMIERRGRFGPFLGCEDYPNCKTVMKLDKEGNVLPPKPPPEPTGIRCYKCKEGELVIRQSKRGPFLGCNRFPKCRTIVSNKMTEKLKAMQDAGQWPPETVEEAKAILAADKKKTPKKKTKKGKS